MWGARILGLWAGRLLAAIAIPGQEAVRRATSGDKGAEQFCSVIDGPLMDWARRPDFASSIEMLLFFERLSTASSKAFGVKV
jgi:hypothetical protein